MGCREEAAGTNWVSTKHMNKDRFRAAKDSCPILLSAWLEAGMAEDYAEEMGEEEEEDELWIVEAEGVRRSRRQRHGRFQCQACGACRYVRGTSPLCRGYFRFLSGVRA